jgi:hypothetical protein
MALMVQTQNMAIPVIEHNTFLTVCTGEESAAPPRRCSSVPARLRSPAETVEMQDFRGKSVDDNDSEAITEVSTEASDEPASCSDAGDIEASMAVPLAYYQQDASQWWCPPILQTPLRTALSSKASSWQPSAPEKQEKPPTWRVGAAQSPEWQTWWEESAADIVAKMSFALGKAANISRVDCRKDAAGWVVTAHVDSLGFYNFEYLQTVAQNSLLQEAEESECIYLLGSRRVPFQRTPMGFFASLGSMRSTKKACWDVYNTGVCPRGCQCLWEHPAYVSTVDVTIDFSEALACQSL